MTNGTGSSDPHPCPAESPSDIHADPADCVTYCERHATLVGQTPATPGNHQLTHATNLFDPSTFSAVIDKIHELAYCAAKFR
jgi:hypothetical protein